MLLQIGVIVLFCAFAFVFYYSFLLCGSQPGPALGLGFDLVLVLIWFINRIKKIINYCSDIGITYLKFCTKFNGGKLVPYNI